MIHKISTALRKLLPFVLLFACININGQKADPPFLKYLNHPWVDSVMNSLSDDEKIGQLVWIAGFANRGIDYDVETSNLIKNYGLGGVIFFQGVPAKQVEMINYFRSITKVPPMIAIDGEWGIGMRLDNVVKFPYQLTLGAITDDSLIYTMGKIISAQMKRAGVNINLAPVADINNNPANPVINFRSFGENPDAVSRKTVMYMKGLQDNGIFAVAKHFPGHGDTEVDSHLDLPAIKHSKERLDSVELKPFRELIYNGISGVMPGHLWVPSTEPSRETPSTISEKVLTGLLRSELGFNGLILSDAMNMGGITKYTKAGEAEYLALKAGMDVLEYVTDPALAISTIRDRIKKGELSKPEIEKRCRMILAAKYWAGLAKPVHLAEEGIDRDLSSPAVITLINELYSSALTVIRNENQLIPVKHLEKLNVATLAINSGQITGFQKRLASYTRTDNYFIDSLKSENAEKLLKKLKSYDLVIAGIFGTQQKANLNFGIPEGLNTFLDSLNGQNKCIITYFGNPYAINSVGGILNAKGVVLAYQENEFTEDLSAQLIFGGFGAKGRLPVTINNLLPSGYGLNTEGGIRLKYGTAESTGVSSEQLQKKVDSIAISGLNAGAYPGCEIMIARKGTVIFSKTYGYHTYNKRNAVKEEDLFDLASVSKISGPLPGLLLLNSQGRFSPDKNLEDYVTFFKGSDKGKLLIRDMLAHQSGLVAWIPFWKSAIKKNGEFKSRSFSHEQNKNYPLKVAEGLYMHKDYRKKIFNEIKKSKLSGQKKYVYSDLTFIIAPEIINSITGEKWYEFVTENVYKHLGAWNIGFNPYLKYPLERIVPTEYDSLFRKQQLHGTVHDEGAAMQGGISGHAGLFATANDLFKLMEMYRRMGSYGGEQIISEDVMKEYTRWQYPENKNRRGLGFDKPLVNNGELAQKNTYPTKGATDSSFGHSGYTGTFVWIDPEKEITYLFFCNRVYPTRNNNKLSDMNIRTEILQAIYDSIRE